MATLREPVDVAEYLLRRLRQVGIESIHGVPGDYNLVSLDYIPKCGLNWVGNVNELNAAYAADGYARVKGMSALMTTFGVGELSALNVHIVGTPSTLSQKNGMLLHHTLGNGDFNVFANMSSNISCNVARLNDASTAADLIDNAIRESYIQSRPAYIALPTDLVTKQIEGARLKQPIDLKLPPNEQEKEDYVVDVILRFLKAAKTPCILVDACAIRHRALEETHALVKASGLPTFVAPMGKGAVDESLPNFGGVYAGDGSNAGVREIVESSDLVLSIGAIKSDFNTAGFTYKTSTLNTIDFHSFMVKVKYSEYHGLRMHGVLRKVAQQLPKLETQLVPKMVTRSAEDFSAQDQTITHQTFWPHLTHWVQEHDIIITETGTSGYGIWEVRFKPNTNAISQILWGSIGYAFGASQGASLAAKEIGGRRTILFTGDGSFQLTAQELSTMIRKELNPIIFVICNDGYTIERYIHGMDAAYNDVGKWKYKDLLPTLGAVEGTYKTYQIRTMKEVQQLLNDTDFAQSSKLRFVELYMPKEDAPKALQMTAEASARNNAKQ